VVVVVGSGSSSSRRRRSSKIGKETRALQVPCRSETSGYSGENNR